MAVEGRLRGLIRVGVNNKDFVGRDAALGGVLGECSGGGRKAGIEEREGNVLARAAMGFLVNNQITFREQMQEGDSERGRGRMHHRASRRCGYRL